jgi:acyl carrier protein
MYDVVRAVHARFGPVDAVVHGSAQTAQQFFRGLTDLDDEAHEAHVRPKGDGLRVLRRVLQEDSPALWVMLSSLSSVLVGLGFIPYAAANQYIDAVAERENRAGEARWVSVNWDGWNFAPDAESAGELAIHPEEGVDLFARLVAADVGGQVIVSTGDLSSRLERWVTMAGGAHDSAASGDGAGEVLAQSVAGALHERPELSSAYVAPRTEVERTLAELWQAQLGVARVGAHDNFFELGGHSLLAIQLGSRIRQALGVTVSVRTLFDAPTVAELAEKIGEGAARTDEVEVRIARALEQVERLSAAEMSALLAADGKAEETLAP